MNIPYWEDTYKNDSIFTFRSKPNKSIIEYEYRFNKSWNILDVGCGDGINSLYLARQGFSNINAFDLSENAIKKLKRLAQLDGLSINAWVGDLCSYQFDKSYHLILSFGTLHFVDRENRNDFIINAKEHTAVGGFHIIQLFTNKVPPTPDIAPYAVGLAEDGEIKELYKDWDIIEFKSYVFEEEHPDVPRHLHASNKIIVQKI